MSGGDRTVRVSGAMPLLASVLVAASLAGVLAWASAAEGASSVAHFAPSTGNAMDAAAGSPTEVPLTLVLVAAGLLAGIAFAAGYFIIPRGGVDEVFLVHESGLLLVHFSKTLRPTKDRDVLVGMLTAVQTFVKDAFSKGVATDLRQMDFGDRKLLICKGSYGYLAVIVQGRAPLGLARRMRTALSAVEAQYRPAIASWDGSSEVLTGADDVLIANLVFGFTRSLVREVRAAGRWIRERFVPESPSKTRAAPQRPGGTTADPRESARALLRRAELQSLRPEYRDMMATALQEIEEGRFSLTGLANLYMVMALQRNPRANIVGWWNLVLRTVREVLWSWPWTPAAQAWVLNPSAPAPPIPPEAIPMPLEIPEPPRDVPADIAVRATAPGPVRAESADSP